ncbi:dual specificity protein phosphatase family protein [Spiroplasma tabanidicola]|uniref:Dual specificity phosphatase n=1 Tax=Spiroplasma tabanidicola TaxID=324079 RepID=A0A6I6CAW5_9MOLU|nr:dual specificity protein phosphatase family protein [Spiroplasma tabanidicola]QGS52071.1 dual specificity phosphatase [Spiroplasma tabanidicola]
MPFKNILNNIYLGDQFSLNLIDHQCELKIGDIYYNILNSKKEYNYKNQYFILSGDKMAINMKDSHDPDDFCNDLFVPAIKFLIENSEKTNIYTHCQLGVSRSASTIFIFLVVMKVLPHDNFKQALKKYIKDFYPYMKLNLGVYKFLENNFPFKEIANKMNTNWGDL